MSKEIVNRFSHKKPNVSITASTKYGISVFATDWAFMFQKENKTTTDDLRALAKMIEDTANQIDADADFKEFHAFKTNG